MDISIESIRDGDEDQRHDLRRQAFGGTDEFSADAPVPERDRTVAAYAGDQLVATVVTLDFEQYWRGRAVPCGGVSGVAVRPEARGQGLAKRLLRESFARMADRGEVLSALYPTTSTLYRSVGYEVAGHFQWRHLPLSTIPVDAGTDLRWRRVELDDPALPAVYEAMAPQVDGFLAAGELWWRRVPWLWANDKGTNRYVYIGQRGANDVAAVAYKYKSSTDDIYDLAVDVLAGTDPEAVAGALAFIGSNGTTAGHVETYLPTELLTRHVPHMQRTKATGDWPWMLRLVDAAGAVAARGFPAGVQGRVDLAVADDVLPANAGHHVFEIADGEGRLLPGGSGRVTVGVGDLAAIYGGADVAALARAGRLGGAGRDDLDLLAAAFVSSPALPFFF